MKDFYIDGCHVFRDGSHIIIKSDNGKEVDFELSEESNTLGKINLPLSNNCTMQCLYCSEAEYIKKQNVVLDEKSAYRIIDAYFDWIKKYSYIETVRLSFDYGGEPVCQLALLEKISKYFRDKCKKQRLSSLILMTTNCAWANELLSRVISCVDEIIVSIDGPKDMHEKYRKYKGENSAFDLIVKNALAIYKVGKLKHISSVITYNTVKSPKEYIDFFVEYFPGISIKTAAVIATGDAISNEIKRVTLADWNIFINSIKELSNEKLTIIDSKPEKRKEYMYLYGCEHMRMTNWFFWLNGKISCCTDRDNSKYYFARLEQGELKIDDVKMNEIFIHNNVNNIEKCNDCLAKYYCSGGCPNFRDGKINCERRVEKYAKLFIEKTKAK